MTKYNDIVQILGEDVAEHFISGVTSGTSSVRQSPSVSPSASPYYPTGMAWVEESYPVITKRTFLFCIHCGRKYLLKEENITTPLMEMNCACGGELEFKEEEDVR